MISSEAREDKLIIEEALLYHFMHTIAINYISCAEDSSLTSHMETYIRAFQIPSGNKNCGKRSTSFQGLLYLFKG